MRDTLHNLKTAEAIAPAVYTADTTPAAIDLLGFDSATLAIHIGAGGITFTSTNKVEFKVTHSDDDSTYEAVTADDLLGVDSVGTGGIVKALTAAHTASDVTRVGYVGTKRYLKLAADFSGTHGTGTPLSAVAILGHPLSAPVG